MVSRNASFHETGVAGILFSPLKWCFVTALLLLALIAATWVVDWILVTKVWSDGIAHLQQLLTLELARSEYIGEIWSGYPAFAQAVANSLYELLFGFTGMHDMGLRFADRASASIPDTVLRDTYIANFDAIQVAMVSTQLFGMRLAALTLALPAVLTVYTVFVTDGLVGRAIRRAAGGKESASLYHRAKHLQLVLGCMLVAAYLLTTVASTSDRLWQLGLVILAVLARLQWAYYKKHL